MAAVLRSTLRPQCPREGHENSRVWLNGHRGPEGHRRPRWQCRPTNGDKPHEFSEPLPRQMTHDGFCDECERGYAPNEGPQGARHYLYSIREVAKALKLVGDGGTYRGAAHAARQHARRGRQVSKREVRYSEHAQLVSDWIETFAPVVYEPYRDFSWPETGSVLFDEVPFRVSTGIPGVRAGIPGGKRTFSILAAMGWDKEREVIRLYKLEAHAERANMGPAWATFMRSLSGEPKRIVCDRGKALVRTTGEVFPHSEIHYCEYHLKERAYVQLRNLGIAVAGTPAYDTVERAFTNPKRFNEMKAAWLAITNPTQRKKLSSYLRHIEPIVMPQLERRSSWPSKANPYGTGALEQHLSWLRMQIDYRVGQFTNRERLNRMLMLMTLRLNGLDDDREYSERIREWLLANGGHPRIARREVTDPLGRPSLRP
jgi:hypothetical protein